MDNRVVRFLGIVALVVSAFSGCASAPSTTDNRPEIPRSSSVLDETRAMVSEAKTAGHAIEPAEAFLRQAEEASAAGDEKQAFALAGKAKQSIAARKDIENARSVVTAAVKDAGLLASDASKLLEAAEAALKAGDPLRASELSSQARRQADNAVAQKRNPTRAVRGQTEYYRVVPGDSLWAIAGRAGVYGNPWSWPLLFQANRARIKDADLIRPGQRLSIGRDFSIADQVAAQRHARERGDWQIGPVESADAAYLDR